MSECKESRDLLAVLMGVGDGGPEDRALLAHADVCPSCRELRDLHEDLEGLDVPAPSEAELFAVRRGVLRSLRVEASAGGPRSWWRGLTTAREAFIGMPVAGPAVAALASVGLLLTGFVAGRLSAGDGASRADADPVSITAQIEHAAARSQSDAGTDSPFVYSQVRVKAVDAETVRLSFDVATRVELVRAKDDPLVAEILVQSLLDRDSIGTRLAAIDAAGRLSPVVRSALIRAMLTDESLAVRLRALGKLTAGTGTVAGDGELQTALLEVLKREESVQMRLLAVDALAAGRVAPEALRAALAGGRPEPGNAVSVRAEDYLRMF